MVDRGGFSGGGFSGGGDSGGGDSGGDSGGDRGIDRGIEGCEEGNDDDQKGNYESCGKVETKRWHLEIDLVGLENIRTKKK